MHRSFLSYYREPGAPRFLLEALAGRFPQRRESDADELLEAFLEAPDRFDSDLLLELIAETGEERHAAKLFASCIAGGVLQENVNQQVLETLGKMKYQPALSTLVRYALESDEYYPNMYAVLGLLEMRPAGLEQRIVAAIESTFGKSLFCEYMPALACLLPEDRGLAEKIYEAGSNWTSPDCNTGYLMALAALDKHSDLKENYFIRALFDPIWEQAYYGHRLQDLGKLGFTFERLWDFIGEKPEVVAGPKSGAKVGSESESGSQSLSESERLHYRLKVFLRLLEQCFDEILSTGPLSGALLNQNYYTLWEAMFGASEGGLTRAELLSREIDSPPSFEDIKDRLEEVVVRHAALFFPE